MGQGEGEGLEPVGMCVSLPREAECSPKVSAEIPATQ